MTRRRGWGVWRSRRTGQFVSGAYAKRYPHLVTRQGRGAKRARVTVAPVAPVAKKAQRVLVKPKQWQETWEVTVEYDSLRKPGQIEDLTFRLVARHAGQTEATVKAALWVAHKQGAAALRDWKIAYIDWRGYHYPTAGVSVEEALENAGGILVVAGWRIARVAS